MLTLELWRQQRHRWPADGCQLLAQYDPGSIVVYQAFRPVIAEEAVALGHFGPSFRLNRMSWIKPGFLWMMHRCAWASRPNQERVLAVRLPRPAFDEVVALAVPASFDETDWPSEEAWEEAVRTAEVLVQWDPDHGPSGAPLARRVIQLGLRGDILRRYAAEWPEEILDVTDLARAGAERIAADELHQLLLPREEPYPAPGGPGPTR